MASTDPFDRLTDVDASLNAKNKIGGASLKVKWNLGEGTLTSVTAWRFWDWKPSNDRDFTGLPITTISANPSKQDQLTQEFRYAQGGERYDFVLGLFGFSQKVRTQGLQEQGPAASRCPSTRRAGRSRPRATSRSSRSGRARSRR